MITFRTLRQYILPPRFREDEGGLVCYALDLIRDASAARAFWGLLMYGPQIDASGTPAPTDALTAMGRDRRILRGRRDTDTTYAAKLHDYLDDLAAAGGAWPMLKQVAAYIGDGAWCRTVDNHAQWYTRDANGVESRKTATDGALWNWDGDASKWSRFWVVIYPGTAWTSEGTWGDGATYGDGGTWGTTATPEEIATLQWLTRGPLWKPAGTRRVSIIIALDAATFDPLADTTDGHWGHWSKVSGGVRVPARTVSTARFVDGA